MKKFIAMLLISIAVLCFAPPASAVMLVNPVYDDNDNPVLMWEMTRAVNRVAMEHPEVKGTVLRTEIFFFGIYAAATDHQIIFNDFYTSNPALLERTVNEDVEAGFHPPLGRCTAGEFLAYHEAAHIVDRQKLKVPRTTVLQRFGHGRELRDQLSGYSFEGGRLNPGEALAEAYASVRCNGGNAVEKELYAILSAD